MCGIAGILGPAGRDESGPARAMADALRHRGPDADGVWHDPEVGLALAHRRLAIVGLGPSGAQPMTSRDGRWVVTYNGEIYDAPTVGRRLESEGVRFRGTSDTEVLVEALARWGRDRTLASVSGMFAFAAWDRRDRRLLLARDRMGEKPLVYGRIGDRFAFASELRALAPVPGCPTDPDPAAVALLLRFKYIPAPWTIWAGVHKVPPATWVEVDADGTAGEPQAYWSVAEVAEAGAERRWTDEAEALDALDDVLSGAVGRQMRSDVPLGAFLSGGIDSSLVSTYAAEASAAPLRTFTIASPDPDHDESSHARAIASRLGAEHTELEVTAEDALAEVPTLAATYDEPFADSSQLPTLLVARLARRDVTVVLSGDGGDELFGGYNRHVSLPAIWSRVGRVPAPVRSLAARAMLAPAPSSWDRVARIVPEARRPRLVGVKVDKVGQVLAEPDAIAAYGRLVSHWNDPLAVVRAPREPITLTHDDARWPRLDTLAEQMMAVDAQTYLPDDVLVKVDRATMAVSLEARVPLLDPTVVEAAARLPLAMKVRDGSGKWALRRLLLRRHPAELVERPKSGFGVPIHLWLRGPLRGWAEDLLSVRSLEATGLLRPEPIRRALADHLAGRRDASYHLWDVLMLQSWLQAR